MTPEELDILQQPGVQDAIRRNLDKDPARLAFGLRQHAALISTQVKYLQRARKKLPAFYEAMCILPPISFEQSSSEATASLKKYSGDTCLDLTCGLGVDSFYLSRGFRRVIAVERDPVLARTATFNFARLGAVNIDVICDTAEHFLRGQLDAGEKADLVYLDPARRSETGSRIYGPEDCHPNVVELLPMLRKAACRIVVKLSPLFDVEEAFRIFGPDAVVEVVSVQGECKEVLIEIHFRESLPEMPTGGSLLTRQSPGTAGTAEKLSGNSLLKTTRTGNWGIKEAQSLVFRRNCVGEKAVYTVEPPADKNHPEAKNSPFDRPDGPSRFSSAAKTDRQAGPSGRRTGENGPPNPMAAGASPAATVHGKTKPYEVEARAGEGDLIVPELPLSPDFFQYLLVPDVTLYKCRLTEPYARTLSVYYPSPHGYFFAREVPENFFGHYFAIEAILPYKPKQLKAWSKARHITRTNFMLRDFPFTVRQISEATGLREGGRRFTAFTRIGTELYAVWLAEA